mmetsp:Transcript_22973/g.63951  ORF Transcript_22973/g.63951 Transcript_22973/m.63951 type:complete len:497 (+) Transcript_22973:2070-3560(+)
MCSLLLLLLLLSTLLLLLLGLLLLLLFSFLLHIVHHLLISMFQPLLDLFGLQQLGLERSHFGFQRGNAGRILRLFLFLLVDHHELRMLLVPLQVAHLLFQFSNASLGLVQILFRNLAQLFFPTGPTKFGRHSVLFPPFQGLQLSFGFRHGALNGGAQFLLLRGRGAHHLAFQALNLGLQLLQTLFGRHPTFFLLAGPFLGGAMTLHFGLEGLFRPSGLCGQLGRVLLALRLCGCRTRFMVALQRLNLLLQRSDLLLKLHRGFLRRRAQLFRGGNLGLDLGFQHVDAILKLGRRVRGGLGGLPFHFQRRLVLLLQGLELVVVPLGILGRLAFERGDILGNVSNLLLQVDNALFGVPNRRFGLLSQLAFRLELSVPLGLRGLGGCIGLCQLQHQVFFALAGAGRGRHSGAFHLPLQVLDLLFGGLASGLEFLSSGRQLMFQLLNALGQVIIRLGGLVIRLDSTLFECLQLLFKFRHLLFRLGFLLGGLLQGGLVLGFK